MKKRIKTGLILLFLSTIAAYILITFVFVQEAPSVTGLLFEPKFIIAVILLFIVLYFFNALRVYELAKAFTDDFTFKDSFVFTMGGIFLGLITPFQSGGIPFQIYMLNKRNVTAGEAGSLLFIRGIQSFIVFILTVPFTFIFFSQLFSNNLVSALFKYLLAFYITVVAVITIAILFTAALKRRVERIGNKWLRQMLTRMLNETENFKSGLLAYLEKAKKHFFISTLYTGIALYVMFSMTYFIVLICGGKDDFFLSFNIQLLLTYLLAFVPTPGSSGFAEGGGALFYSLLVPKSMIVIYVFLWRLITTYFPAFIGIISIWSYMKAFMKSEKHS